MITGDLLVAGEDWELGIRFKEKAEGETRNAKGGRIRQNAKRKMQNAERRTRNAEGKGKRQNAERKNQNAKRSTENLKIDGAFV